MSTRSVVVATRLVESSPHSMPGSGCLAYAGMRVKRNCPAVSSSHTVKMKRRRKKLAITNSLLEVRDRDIPETVAARTGRNSAMQIEMRSAGSRSDVCVACANVDGRVHERAHVRVRVRAHGNWCRHDAAPPQYCNILRPFSNRTRPIDCILSNKFPGNSATWIGRLN